MTVKAKANEEEVSGQPETTEITEQTQAQDLADFDAGFSEFDDDTDTTQKLKDAESKNAEGEEDEAGSGDEGTDKKKPAQDAKPAAEPAAQETAADRLARLAEKVEPPATENIQPPPSKEAPPVVKEQAPPTKAPEDFIKRIVDGVPETDREKVNELLLEFPEMKALFQSIASTLSASQPQAPAPSHDGANERLLYQCELKHKGSIAVASSPEFQDWLGKQAPAIQVLADSGDIDTSVTIIQAYQETLAKGAAGKHDTTTAAAREKKNALLKTTAKPTGSKQVQAAADPKDFDAAFDEFAKD